MTKKIWWKNSTTWIIIGVIIFAYFIINKPIPETDAEVAKCIGENSILYASLGCSHCATQKDMFGENVKYLNIIDCFYEKDKCEGIEGYPTWEIKGETYLGVQDIEELKKLTGCQNE